MSAKRTGATALRLLQQLRRDPRTVLLLLVVPIILVTLVKWVFDASPAIFQRVGVPLVGIFPLTSMFLVTSIAMLRERTTGTLERLMTMPIARLDLLAGYALAFGGLAIVQASAVSLVAFGLLDLHVAGPMAAVVLFAVLNAVLGMALGLFLSAFARTEFQAVQFMPAFILPQFLLCGLLAPREAMLPALEAVSYAMPMTYAYDALDRVARDGSLDARLLGDAAVVLGVTLVALALGAATLRRRSA